MKMMEDVGVRLCLERKSRRLGDEVIDEERDWKTWRKVKTCLLKAMESRRTKNYRTKEQQSQLYQEQEDECYLWSSQNLHGRKTSSIMTMQEQMVETRSWKAVRGLDQDGHCSVCHERDETIERLLLNARSWQTASTCQGIIEH